MGSSAHTDTVQAMRCSRYSICFKLLSVLLIIAMILPAPLAVFMAAAEDEKPMTRLSTTCTDLDGNAYSIHVSFDEDAGIPDDAVLSVSALSQATEKYNDMIEQTSQVLNRISDVEDSIHFLDIKIVDADDSHKEYQPAEGSSVDVKIRMQNTPENELSVIHFGEEPEILDSTVSGDAVSFETTGFSVYAIVDKVEGEYNPSSTQISDLSQIDFEDKLIISATTASNKTYYLADGTVSTTNAGIVINRTPANYISGAVDYYFDFVEGSDDHFYIYNLEGGSRKYIKLTRDTKAEFTSLPGTLFTAVPCGDDHPNCFYIAFPDNNKIYYLNLRKGDSGKGFSGSTYDDLGSMLSIRIHETPPEDSFGLDGKSFGIVLPISNNNYCAELTSNMQSENEISARQLMMQLNPLDENQKVIVTEDTDMTMWTFHTIGSDTYIVTTEVNGVTKYLSIDGTNARIVDTRDETCEIHVTKKNNTYRFSGADGSLALIGGKVVNGFGGRSANNTYEYFRLAERSELTNDDFVDYAAGKVSISDRQKVPNGSQVVIYTRIWDDNAKRYNYYVVDHDGKLVYVFDEGDTIRWSGSQINTMLWNFTEYYYEGTQTPNYYYELQNVYSGKYLAPQIEGGQVLSDETIGININGRRYANYSSTIMAWDDPHYDYAGLAVQDGRVVPVPISQAQEFYFAVMDPHINDLSTVETIDNDEYGIKMKMVKFPLPNYNTAADGGGGRNRKQTNVLGAQSTSYVDLKLATRNLVTNQLDADGYPRATYTGTSLEELFGDATDANHLFIKSIYDGTGYFQYFSTQNYAELEQDGNFTVYNQLGTIETNTNSQGHGQFMPYNELDPTRISSQYTNITDVYNKPLPINDPRRGEQLYSFSHADAQYFFGMEMEASFIQSEDGKDAWGHDIIFEFAGDDDMWLYIDGELVLDLGGIHSALVGKINFRTGDVEIPNYTLESNNTVIQQHTTLRQIFEDNYVARNPNASQAEITEYLDSIFVPGGTVFKDFSSHTMKMFYMERGAGASNLQMRFNLTTASTGQLLLGKKVSGTDKQDYASAKFPYQIWYYDTDYNQWKTVTRTQTIEDGSAVYNYTGVQYVNYKDTATPVEYSPSYNGYDNVFFLKPGQVADIQFPNDSVQYYVKECRVDTSIYDQVSVNNTPLTGVQVGTNLADFSTQPEEIGERKVVNFDNHVDQDSLRNLIITKQLYDIDGTTPLSYAQDQTGFRFRIYIGDQLDYYRLDHYYVKDPSGYYCTYNSSTASFASTGKNDFSQLTAAQQAAATFTTSPSGAIDKIPTGYSVEIRNLVVGTKFKVEERESDIPKGYSFMNYERVDGSYITSPGDTVNSGTIRDNSSPHIAVKNKRGWGLTVNKVWSDSSFMLSHDNIYFAVFYNGDLLPGTVRQMRTEVTNNHPIGESSLYYYFDDLLQGASFSDYVVREVMPENPVVDANGVVTSYSSISPVIGSTYLTNGGVEANTNQYGTFSYSASYAVGQAEGAAENIRVDTVTNSRPGIRIVKTDMLGNPLQGGVFTLKDSDGYSVGTSSSYTSGTDGLVTIAYLHQGSFTLTETKSPDGYKALIDDITLIVDSNNNLSVSGAANDSVFVDTNDPSGMTTVTIKNMQIRFSVLKVDEQSQAPLARAHFALYRQVVANGGTLRKDYFPIQGYEDIVSDVFGVLSGIDQSLAPGTYYLTETAAPNGYLLLDEDVVFTILPTGDVVLKNSSSQVALSDEVIQGDRQYKITISDKRSIQLEVLKASSENDMPLSDAGFNLYREDDFNDTTGEPLLGAEPVASGMTDGTGLLDFGAVGVGNYYLVETHSPSGYFRLMDPVYITVRKDGTTFTWNGETYEALRINLSKYRITVYNDPYHYVSDTGIFNIFPPVIIAGITLCAAFWASCIIRKRRLRSL